MILSRLIIVFKCCLHGDILQPSLNLFSFWAEISLFSNGSLLGNQSAFSLGPTIDNVSGMSAIKLRLLSQGPWRDFKDSFVPPSVTSPSHDFLSSSLTFRGYLWGGAGLEAIESYFPFFSNLRQIQEIPLTFLRGRLRSGVAVAILLVRISAIRGDWRNNCRSRSSRTGRWSVDNEWSSGDHSHHWVQRREGWWRRGDPWRWR